MISPSPTQAPPDPEVKPREKEIKSTPVRPRTGQAPAALFVKSIFRPIIKGIYYLLHAIGNHKLVTLGLIVLLLASSSLATYFATGQWPLGVGHDQFNFHVNGKGFSGEHVKNWLYALRDGDGSALTLIGQEMAQGVELSASVVDPRSDAPTVINPSKPQPLIDRFSQAKAHLNWKNITVIQVSQAPDTTLDSFIEVDLSASGPGGNVSGIMIWHFITAPSGDIIAISLASFRRPLA